MTTTSEQYGQQAEQSGPKLIAIVCIFLLVWTAYKKGAR
jgi:hypothetical protein